MAVKLEIFGLKGSYRRDGGVVFQVPYAMDTLADVRDLPRTWEGLIMVGDVDVSPRESGKINAVVTYEGLLAGGIGEGSLAQDEDGDWEVDPSLSEEPLESSPILVSLLLEYDGYFDEEDRLRFPERLERSQPATRGLFGGDVGKVKIGDRNPMFGRETYLLPGAIVRRTRVLASVPDDVMSRAGQVIKRLPIEALKDVDWGDADWLTLQARPSKFGNAVRLVEEWIKSPPGGWPPSQTLIDKR
jgi:hypothetical protein